MNAAIVRSLPGADVTLQERLHVWVGPGGDGPRTIALVHARPGAV